MHTARLLGVDISTGTREELLRTVTELLGRGGCVYTVNPLMLTEGVRDPSFLRVLNRATMCIPDGVGVKRALLARGEKTDVLCGVELGEALLSRGGRVAFVGGMPGVAREAYRRLRERYGGLTLSFCFDGYTFDESTVRTCLERHRPTLFFACLGTPKQEILIDRIRDASPGTLYIGLGGSFDVYAGRVRRAPCIVRRMGLEWMYRMVRQPKRIRKLPALCRFSYICKEEKRKIARKTQERIGNFDEHYQN